MYRKFGAPCNTGLESALGHASWQTEIRNIRLTIILDNDSDNVMYSDAFT